ncbi:MAG: hypothetical protein IJM57_09025 [Lachnospiraceae bacterium]|nr:hypothetical protein [Lachnospiraceae bacterium]
MALLTEFLREFGLFIFYIIVAVCGVLAGRAYRNHKNAKIASESADSTGEM